MSFLSFIFYLTFFGIANCNSRKESALVGEGLKKDGCILLFFNSTSCAQNLRFNGKNGEHALMIREDSVMSVEHCKLITDGTSYIPFICSGYISMRGIELIGKEKGDASVATFCLNKRDDEIGSGKFIMSDSKFNGYVMISDKGTFLSSGVGEEQIVKNCELFNISIKKGGKERSEVKYCSVMKCLVENVKMSGCEDSLYGVILSGVTGKTVSEFRCKNSTFININRHTLQNNNNNNKVLKEKAVKKQNIKDKKSSNSVFGRFYEDNTDRVAYENKFENIRDSIFEKCEAMIENNNYNIDSCGGGLLIVDSNEDMASSEVSVYNCKFNGCKGYFEGGGLYLKVGKAVVTHCTFDTCMNPPFNRLLGSGYNNRYGYGGGASIRCYSCSVVSECLFNNSVSYSGGGLSLIVEKVVNCDDNTKYDIIHDCCFKNCNASVEGISNDHCVGGGVYFEIDREQSISNCFFSSCYSYYEGGAIGFVAKYFEADTIKCCYFQNCNSVSENKIVYLKKTECEATDTSEDMVNPIDDISCSDTEDPEVVLRNCNGHIVRVIKLAYKADIPPPDHDYGYSESLVDCGTTPEEEDKTDDNPPEQEDKTDGNTPSGEDKTEGTENLGGGKGTGGSKKFPWWIILLIILGVIIIIIIISVVVFMLRKRNRKIESKENENELENDAVEEA